MKGNSVYWVIMAGGSGTRFWPLSRKNRPKQLLPICTADNNKPMVRVTLERVLQLSNPENIIVVTGENIKDEIKRIMKEIPSENFLFEPEGKNTAPCIGWAAIHIKAVKGEDSAVISVLPSDHYIGNEDRYFEILEEAVEAAKDYSKVVTIGIPPSSPSTGYGYIEIGENINNNKFMTKGRRFVEKPDRTLAEMYLRSQRFLWNSGMFFFKVGVILSLIEKHLPELYEILLRIEEGIKRGEEEKVVREEFHKITPISIDYGVMEKINDFIVLKGDFQWSDVGNWEAVYELTAGGRDAHRNVSIGDLIAINSSGCLTWAPKDKIIAIIGVEDLIIVDTEDALLVCPREQSQRVKKVVEILKKEGKEKYI